jgi:hypothetical protein
VTVSFPRRIWWRDPNGSVGPSPHGFGTSCVLEVDNWTAAQWASQIRRLVSCPNVQVQGRQWVDGVDAIRIETHAKRVRVCSVFTLNNGTRNNGTRERRCSWGNEGYPGMLFIDPSTYLPIRYVDPSSRDGEQMDFRFLPPNPANLAKLRIGIPPGFTRA